MLQRIQEIESRLFPQHLANLSADERLWTFNWLLYEFLQSYLHISPQSTQTFNHLNQVRVKQISSENIDPLHQRLCALPPNAVAHSLRAQFKV